MPRETDVAKWMMDGGADGLAGDDLVRVVIEKFPGLTIRELGRAVEIADELQTADDLETAFRNRK